MSHAWNAKEPSGQSLVLGDEAKFPPLRFRRGWVQVPDDIAPKRLAYYLEICEQAAGTYGITYVPPDSEEATPDDVDALVCPICDKRVKSKFALAGHMRSHVPQEM